MEKQQRKNSKAKDKPSLKKPKAQYAEELKLIERSPSVGSSNGVIKIQNVKNEE